MNDDGAPLLAPRSLLVKALPPAFGLILLPVFLSLLLVLILFLALLQKTETP